MMSSVQVGLESLVHGTAASHLSHAAYHEQLPRLTLNFRKVVLSLTT